MWAELKAVLEGLKNQDGVTSFNGRDGIVVGEEGDYNITDMGDVVISVPTTNQILRYDGSDWVNDDETVYVPYTGATANVTLGEYGLKAGWYGFDLTPTGTPTDRGTMYWDDSRSTVALIMNGTTQHIGQDQFYYVKNSTGSSIPKGTAVGFAGTDGGSGHLLIKPFRANGVEPSSYFMGVTAETIANGAFGQVMAFGKLKGVNTSAFTDGDILYVSTATAGAFQTTVPTAPNNIIQVAAVVSAANNGTISVRPTLGSKLTSDESVVISSPTNGQVLQYNSTTGVWQNATISTTNIYTADGNLAANRTVGLNDKTLTFVDSKNGSASITIQNNAVGLTQTDASFAAVTDAGTAAFGKRNVANFGYKIISASNGYIYDNNTIAILADGAAGTIKLAAGGSSTAQMTIFSNGNIGIGTTTDAGFRLDVSGTIRSTTFVSAGTGSTGGYYVGATSGSGAFMIRGYADTTNPGIEKVAANNSPFEFYQRGQSSNAYTFRFSMTDNNARSMSVGSGSVDNIRVLLGFGLPNANNITGNVLSLMPVYNQTGSTYTGTILNCIYYNPTLTSLTGATHNFINAVSGNVLFCTSSGYVGIGATADTSYKLSVDGDLRVYGNIRTAQPTGGTGIGVWRLGSTATGTFIMSTTVCVEIEIGGTLYKLATVS
jgi:hypothetical protein